MPKANVDDSANDKPNNPQSYHLCPQRNKCRRVKTVAISHPKLTHKHPEKYDHLFMFYPFRNEMAHT